MATAVDLCGVSAAFREQLWRFPVAPRPSGTVPASGLRETDLNPEPYT